MYTPTRVGGWGYTQPVPRKSDQPLPPRIVVDLPEPGEHKRWKAAAVEAELPMTEIIRRLYRRWMADGTPELPES